MVCSLAVSNFYILGAVLLTAVLVRRAFCAYACPIGALSEWIRKGGKSLGIRSLPVPQAADRMLSMLKYPMLLIILYFTWRTGELVLRGFDPCYALISRHGEDITFWAYVISGAVAALSLFVSVPFCRWLCPLAAVLNPFSRAGVARIRRNPETCVDCGKCARACAMAIPVDRSLKITAARCTSCLDCLEACPEKEEAALTYGLPAARGSTNPVLSRVALLTVFFLVMAASVSASYLFPVPSFVWSRSDSGSEMTALALEIENLNCRGNANLLVYYLDRDDELRVEGALRLEAWPEPGAAEATVYFDPALTSEAAVKAAVTEAYYDHTAGVWRVSPFKIKGYDPLNW
jgi:ferredoxin